MKGITNYIAALITAAMIFTSVAFFITSMLQQVNISNYALNTMVEVSDRSRENLGISYVFKGNDTLVLTIVNAGSVEVTLAHVAFIDKDLNLYKISVNATTIPIGSIITLWLQLPVPPDQIESIKITTTRGNVFDVLSSREKPLNIVVLVNTTSVAPADYFEVELIIVNSVFRNIELSTSDISVDFINHVTGENITTYFTLRKAYPPDPVVIGSGQEVVYRLVYKYSGGLVSGLPIDIRVYIDTVTVSYEEVHSSAELIYAFNVQ